MEDKNSELKSILSMPSEEENNDVDTRSKICAYVTALVSVSIVAVSLPCVQILDGIIPDFELNAWRFVVQLVLVIPIVARNKCDVSLERKFWPKLLLIIMCYIVFNLAYYTAAVYIPVANLDGLNCTVIILSNLLISVMRKMDRKLYMYISAITAVVGVILLTQPEFLFTGNSKDSLQTNWTSPCKTGYFMTNTSTNESLDNYTDKEPSPSKEAWKGYGLISIAGLAAAGGFNAMQIFVKDIDPFVLSFWIAVAGSLGSVLPMLIIENVSFPSSPFCIGILLMHAFGVAQTALISPYCLKYMSPSVFSLINTLHLIILFVFQYTLLKDIMPTSQNWIEIVGVVICTFGCSLGPIWTFIQDLKQ